MQSREEIFGECRQALELDIREYVEINMYDSVCESDGT